MLKRARIAVLVSGGGTNLEHLLLAQERGDLPHGEIAVVISGNPDAYALERAKNHAVPAVCIDRKQFSASELAESGDTPQGYFEKMLSQKLADFQVDFLILAGFLSILSEDFVKQWPEKILNIHPSLIPAFCGKGFYGLKVHEAALNRGVKVTGATVHFVNEIPDGGKILLQKAVEIQPDDTPEILQKRVMEQAEWVLLPQAAELLARKIAEENALLS